MRRRTIRKCLITMGLLLAVPFSASGAECIEHDFQLIEEPPTCTESGYRGYQCRVCGQLSQMESIAQLGHDLGEWTEIDSPTCTKKGTEEAVCNRCGDVQSRSLEKIPHDYEISTVEPTCTTEGCVLYQCKSCNNQLRTNITPELGHDYTVWVEQPTCKKDGYTLHTCMVCGYEEKTDKVKATGHTYEPTIVAPTCTADGYTRYQCTNCDDSYRTDPVDKTGHRYNNGIITKEPTWTTMGRKTFTCYGCGITYQETTPKLSNPFVDVQEGAYYYDSVIWAVGMEIVAGVDATHFAPDNVCTRAQVVTFLWRASGRPDPISSQCPFVDLAPGSYYYNAVLWAVEQGITKGMDDTHFGPDQPCTRAQVVTFLHRAKGNPRPKYGSNFSDVSSSAYYYQAVCWASENGITAGTGGNAFSPNAVCTRGQIVSFLYRAKDK